MKLWILIALVLLLLIVGLPLAMGMGTMEPCPACNAPELPMAAAMCLAIVALVGLFVSLMYGRRIFTRDRRPPRFLTLSRLDRPPQYA